MGEKLLQPVPTYFRVSLYIVERHQMTKLKPYPNWICFECGNKYGRRECGVATWHPSVCGICGKEDIVTEPRDFGHLKDGWEKAVKK